MNNNSNNNYQDILDGLRALAGVCDGAHQIDGQGFNKYDSDFGKSLASKPSLTDKQAESGKKLIIKYQNQLPVDLVERVKSLEIKPLEVTINAPSPETAINTLVWSTPKTVKGGTLQLETADPTDAFWSCWKKYKKELQSLGVSVSNNKGVWQVCRWVKLKDEEIVMGNKSFELPELSLFVASKLLPHQPLVVQHLVTAIQEYNSAGDLSSCGVGKTFSSLAVAKTLGMNVLAIVKKNAIPSWRNAAKYMEVEATVTNIEQVKTGNTQWGKWVKNPVTNSAGETHLVENFEWAVPENTLVIIDECHILKNMASQNCHMAINAKLQGLPLILLSATAATNPLEMKAIGYILGLFPLKDYWKWAMDHGVRKGRWGMEFVGGARELQKIHRSIFQSAPPRGVRLTTDNIPNFPEALICPESIDFDDNGRIQRIYEQMQEEIERLMQRSQGDTSCILTEILRARQKVELLKIPTLAEMAEDLVQEGNSAVIFLSFKESIQSIAAKLKTTCIIDGEHTGSVREENRLRFQRGTERVCICSLLAAESIDLDDQTGEYPRVSLINSDFSVIRAMQAIGRTNRAKSKTKSIHKFCFAAGTIEEKARQAIFAKSRNLSLLNDNDLKMGLPI